MGHHLTLRWALFAGLAVISTAIIPSYGCGQTLKRGADSENAKSTDSAANRAAGKKASGSKANES